MLRARVTLNRRIRHPEGWRGYGVTLDGEIPFLSGDAEGVLEKVAELFHLAEEALDLEIDRDRVVITSDGEHPSSLPNSGHDDERSRTDRRSEPLPINNPNYANSTGNPDAATPKQLQFLRTMARRHKLDDRGLEGRIGEVLGRPCGVSTLSKKEAGRVIDHLTGG